MKPLKSFFSLIILIGLAHLDALAQNKGKNYDDVYFSVKDIQTDSNKKINSIHIEPNYSSQNLNKENNSANSEENRTNPAIDYYNNLSFKKQNPDSGNTFIYNYNINNNYANNNLDYLNNYSFFKRRRFFRRNAFFITPNVGFYNYYNPFLFNVYNPINNFSCFDNFFNPYFFNPYFNSFGSTFWSVGFNNWNYPFFNSNYYSPWHNPLNYHCANMFNSGSTNQTNNNSQNTYYGPRTNISGLNSGLSDNSTINRQNTNALNNVPTENNPRTSNFISINHNQNNSNNKIIDLKNHEFKSNPKLINDMKNLDQEKPFSQDQESREKAFNKYAPAKRPENYLKNFSENEHRNENQQYAPSPVKTNIYNRPELNPNTYTQPRNYQDNSKSNIQQNIDKSRNSQNSSYSLPNFNSNNNRNDDIRKNIPESHNNQYKNPVNTATPSLPRSRNDYNSENFNNRNYNTPTTRPSTLPSGGNNRNIPDKNYNRSNR